MELKQIEVFLEVVRQKSFSKAAEALYISQPTVSAHIRSLEEHFGCRLLVRSTRQIQLTPEGELLYQYGLQIESFCRRAETDIRQMSGEKEGNLVIAASSVPAQYFLPDMIRLLHGRFPGLKVCIRNGDTKDAISAVRNGGAEIGIVGNTERGSDLCFEPLFQEKLVIITPASPFFRGIPGSFPEELFLSYPFVMREDGSGTRSAMQAFMEPLGIGPEKLRISAEVGSTEGVIRCVEDGLGISIVSKLAADYYLPYGRILAFEMERCPMTRAFYAVTRTGAELQEPAKVLLENIRSARKGLVG